MYDFEEKIREAYNLHTNGYFNEAETIYSELLVKDKKNITIIYLLGLTYFQQKRYKKAYKLIKIAAKKRPYSAEYFYNLSLTCLKLGKINKALSYAEKSTKLNPLSAKSFNIYAECLKNTEQKEEAIFSYQKALNLDSSLYEEVIINQGMILIDLKKYEEAEKKFSEALVFNTNSKEASLGMAKSYLYKKEFSSAIKILNKVRKKNKNDPVLENLRADSYIKCGQPDEALSILKNALKNNPNNDTIQNNIGYTLRELECFTEAKECFKKILSRNPKHIDANVNLGLVLLSEESFKDGWKHYEFRKYQENVIRKNSKISLKRWRNENLSDKKLLVWTEQGLGDEILQASLLNDLRVHVKDLAMICSERLVSLFQRSFPNITTLSTNEFYNLKENYNNFFSYPLLDTSKFLRDSSIKFKNKGRYLTPDINKTQILRKKYLNFSNNQSKNPIIIGLSWKSENEIYGNRNSIPLNKWKSVYDVFSNCARPIILISTQYNCDLNELRTIESEFNTKIYFDNDISYSKELDPPVSQIDACDFIISTSTTTAQIGGALGKKTWHLPSNGLACGWYWLNKGNKTPWYPEMVQIRKKYNQSVDTQISELARNIKDYIS